MSDEITATLAVLVQRIEQVERKLDKVVDDHEARLRRLEAWSYALPVTVVLALGSVAVAIVGAILNR